MEEGEVTKFELTPFKWPTSSNEKISNEHIRLCMQVLHYECVYIENTWLSSVAIISF